MGWDFGWRSKKEVVAHLERNWSDTCEMIDRALVGNTHYMVIRNKETGKRFIAVTLIKHVRGAGYPGRDWGYKGMDEGMGPYVYTCPERLLAQSDVTEGFAPAWREECRKARAAKKVDRKFLDGLQKGDTFLYNGEPVMFLYRYTTRSGQTRYAGTPAKGGTYRYPANKIRKPASADALPTPEA